MPCCGRRWSHRESGPIRQCGFSWGRSPFYCEGLEALLIIVAILAFLNRAKRPEVLPPCRLDFCFGVGVATWVVARFFIDISGASREPDRRLFGAFCRCHAAERGLVDAPKERRGCLAGCI